ncbi:YveK family protein [Streptomyces sp. YIM S03343]
MIENPTRSHRPSAPSARLRALPPWTLLAAGTLTGGLLGGAYGVLTPPTYTATSYVIAVPTDRSDPASALGFATAYGRVATQLAVLGDAQAQAGVPVDTLRHSVQTSASPDAPMVAVSATSARPRLAAGMANAVARALTRRADATKATTHVELVEFSRAVTPADPTSPSPAVTGLIGASAGGLLGGLALLVRPQRDDGTGRRTVSVAGVPGPATAADAHEAL